MKKLIVLLGILSCSIVSFGNGDRTVYICTGKSATKYHRVTDCSGLNNCKASIVAVTEAKAIQLKRTRCKKCW